jgi:hypothetical protein
MPDSPSWKQPSVWIPLLMSFAAFALLLGYVATRGIDQSHTDERAPARIFQLLLAGQLPMIAWLAFSWLPRAPLKTSLFLALQAGAVVAAIATVNFFESLV